MACRATRGCCVRQMAFTAYDGNSEAINFLDASLSENGSSVEKSICADTTVTDSDMSYYERHILHTRLSRPQFVDQWTVYVLARKNPYRTGEALDGWVWKKALTCPAREPLSKANIFSALWNVRHWRPPYRLMYQTNRVHRGADGVGYELMRGAVILKFTVNLAEGGSLEIRKDGSGTFVWGKDLDGHLSDTRSMYTSNDLLSDFIRCFGLRKAAYIQSPSWVIEEGVLARFQAVCSEEHWLCYY